MTDLVFNNSLTHKLEPFEPLTPGQVSLYHCGPTVYKRQHLGNMRRFLFADFLRRTLELFGYTVTEITNITDVGHLTADDIDAGEDKIEKEARAQATTPQEIADHQLQLFLQDIDALTIQRSHDYPRASQHIADMQQLIEKLIAKGHAYATATGVYFDVTSFPAYGKLSGNTLRDIEAGKRVDVREEKHHPADFALWVIDPTHLQQWDSPWGTGYPGWHIECSAMSMAALGERIDIHTGGEDNRFPHHENEIAQSEAATGQPFVRYWLHNRHLQLGRQKLAKRSGEQLTLDTVRERGFSPLAFRLLVFGSHYRSPMEFSWEALAGAQENLHSLQHLIRRLLEAGALQTPAAPAEAVVSEFKAALGQDLNTPQALAIVMTYLRQANHQLEQSTAAAAAILATLQALDKVLGLIEPLMAELQAETIPSAVQQLAQAREVARQQQDFPEADRLRTAIEQAGYSVEDTPAGPRLTKRRL